MIIGFDDLVPAPVFELAENLVAGDAEKPGSKRSPGRIVAVQTIEESQEGFLNGVLGNFGGSAHVQGKAVDPAPMAVVKGGPGGFTAVSGASEEPVIGGLDFHRSLS